MSALLEKVKDWKHECGLNGADEKYDFFPACYGNPDSNIVFLAEIPSLRGLEEFRKKNETTKKYPKEDLWKASWDMSPGDRVLRGALKQELFIPKDADNEPSRWKCWITDLVKCPEYNDVWRKKIEMAKKNEILSASALLLEQELRIIRPDIIAVLGDETLHYYKTHLEPRIDTIDVSIPHYARPQTKDDKKHLRRRIRKLRKLLNMIPNSH